VQRLERRDIEMRTHGTLIKWNDERGFGFIAPAQGDGEIFVHISAFPRDGVRPSIGELISYETQPGTDGRLRAVAVMRPGRRVASARQSGRARRGGKERRLGSIVAFLAIIAIGVYGYSRIGDRGAVPAAARPERQGAAAKSRENYSCDGRTRCSQMTSCAEARYFLRHCPGTKMDGDYDGEPCESQWCN
jgi:cold shock CspA family protein